MGFWLVPKSVTLNDLERRNDRVVWVISPNSVALGPYYVQVAQLSQRDRAAGWVSDGQKWKNWNWETIFTDNILVGLYSTTATYLASKEIEIGEKTQNKGCYAV